MNYYDLINVRRSWFLGEGGNNSTARAVDAIIRPTVREIHATLRWSMETGRDPLSERL